jgi:hypothetical protein
VVKPQKVAFTEALESVLVNIWGGTRDHLDDSLIKKTRRAIIEIRGVYRFKGEFPKKYPSSIRYLLAKNRAGYLAGFGQRHAYLTYAHLKKIEAVNPDVIPKPEGEKGELTITILGAGAAIESYGVCLFYNEDSQKLRRLRLNLIDKVDAWAPNRHIVFVRLLKERFSKLDIIPTDMTVDLTKDSIQKLANNYDALTRSNILLIYNVMNEIHASHSDMVWKNVKFILDNCSKPLLILLAEPSAPNAAPRINWIKTQLAQYSEIIHSQDAEEFFFETEPTKIDFENTGIGLNDRLFGQIIDGDKPPILKTSLKRTHLACGIRPRSSVSIEQVTKQLAMLKLKRGVRGRFIKQEMPQGTFWDNYPDWYK